jgi:predicted kinase
MTDLVIILGRPASGKTTLARRLAAELSVPILSKDDIKEALFEVLGCSDREHSRRLSDASFAAQLRLAETQLEVGLCCLLEGNWRAEHAGGVLEVLARTGARAAQVWCRASAGEIQRRFAARIRHPGHLDCAELAEEVRRTAGLPPAFMDLHGPRWIYDSEHPAAYDALLRDLKIRRL